MWNCRQSGSARCQVNRRRAGEAMDLTKARLVWVELYAKSMDAGLGCHCADFYSHSVQGSSPFQPLPIVGAAGRVQV
jgi:hypothetical protein